MRMWHQAVVWPMRWNSLVLFIYFNFFFNDVKMFKNITGRCITTHRSVGRVLSCSLVSSTCHINIMLIAPVSRSLDLLYPVLCAVHPCPGPCHCRSTFGDTRWDGGKVPQAGTPTTRPWGSSQGAKCGGKLGRNVSQGGISIHPA